MNYATVTGELAAPAAPGIDPKTGRPCLNARLVQHQGDECAAVWYITATKPAAMRFLEKAKRGDWIAASGPFVAAFVGVEDGIFAPCFDIDADLIAEAAPGRRAYES